MGALRPSRAAIWPEEVVRPHPATWLHARERVSVGLEFVLDGIEKQQKLDSARLLVPPVGYALSPLRGDDHRVPRT